MIKSILKMYGRGAKGFFENRSQPRIDSGINKKVIGQSVENRNIEACLIGEGPEKIIYFSAIHGNEVGSAKLMILWANYLNKNLSLIPHNHQMVIIPVLNPDGYQNALGTPDYFKGGKIGRFNANKVDLNRNFPEKWQKNAFWYYGGKETPVNAGKSPVSEPETRALTDFINNNKVKIIWAFHSRDFTIVSGDDDYSVNIAQKYKDMLNKKSKHNYRYIPNDEWHREKYTGHIKLWLDTLNISFVEVEMSSRWSSGWLQHQSALTKTLKSNS